MRFWDLQTNSELFALHLPTNQGLPTPLWDFDLRCTPTGCWLAVPLTRGKLALYDLVPTAATLDQALALAETDWERDLRPLLSQYVEADTALRSVGVLRELFTA